MEDKVKLLETAGMNYASYCELDGYVNYFYGCLLPSTGYINDFDLVPYFDGILLQVPRRDDLSKLEPVIRQDKMFEVYKRHLTLQRTIGMDNVGDLNEAISSKQTAGIIMVSEAMQEKRISRIAEDIAERYKDGVRIVLISGPSSSGKTTFCKRLQVQLITNLIHPIGISLDDYFLNREDTPRDENGDYDFESLYALDLPFFNNELQRLLNGEEIETPSFNFNTGRREFKGNRLKMKDNSVIVIEGIHGLNPDLTSMIDDKYKYKIYVSVLTSISLDNQNWIPTTDNRLIRRIVRDYRFRGYSAQDTISRWPSVRRGEDKWIFPYQENADAMFNSALIYELAVLKQHAEPLLFAIEDSSEEYQEAKRLLKFFDYFLGVSGDNIPNNSIIREFIGGSCFNV
jgi:uridine kinase